MVEWLKGMLSVPLTDMKPDECAELSDIDQRLMAAARELFAEKGYDGAKTLAIAKKAGVSEKTLFQHFGSKEQLFIRTVYPSLLESIRPLIKREASDFQEGVEGVARPIEDRLQELAKNRLRFAQDNPQAVKLLLQELLLRAPYREAVTDFWMDQITPVIGDFFEARKASGEIRDFPVTTIMRVVVPVLLSYSLIRGVLLPEGDWDDDKELHMMLDIILNGLLPR